MRKKGIDHLGNEFPSIGKMCARYNVEYDTYNTRIKQGWSVEEALLTPSGRREKVVKDHHGNVYSSVSEMAKKYHIPDAVLRGRIYNGWDMEKALTTPLLREI